MSLADKLENILFSALGAQAVTISTKVAEIMFCFFCGELKAREESLQNFDVALCRDCQKHPNASFYRGNRRPRYRLPYAVNPPLQPVEVKICSLCDSEYETSFLFENFGFDIPVCPVCLQDPDTNIWLSNEHVKAIWRK